MSTWQWIAVGVPIWLLASAVVGPLVGQMIRYRDRQVPPGTPPS